MPVAEWEYTLIIDAVFDRRVFRGVARPPNLGMVVGSLFGMQASTFIRSKGDGVPGDLIPGSDVHTAPRPASAPAQAFSGVVKL